MNTGEIEKNLVEQIRLTPLQARIFVLVTVRGRMSADGIASALRVPPGDALARCQSLVKLGGFIDISPTEFEAMHPRFAAVNMYRRMCEREGIGFGRNKTVDSMGAALERRYDDARTK